MGAISVGRAVSLVEELREEAAADPDTTGEERSLLERLASATAAAQQEIGVGGSVAMDEDEAVGAGLEAADLDADEMDTLGRLVARLRQRRGERRVEAIQAMHGAVLAVAGLEPSYEDGPRQVGLRATRFLGRGHAVLREAALAFAPPVAHVKELVASTGAGKPAPADGAMCPWCLGDRSDDGGACPESLSGRSCRADLPVFSPELRAALEVLVDESRGGAALLPLLVGRLALMMAGRVEKPLGPLETAPLGGSLDDEGDRDQGDGPAASDASPAAADPGTAPASEQPEHGLPADTWRELAALSPLGAMLGFAPGAALPSDVGGSGSGGRVSLRAALACLQALPGDAWPAEARPFLAREAALVSDALRLAGVAPAVEGQEGSQWTELDHLAVAGVARLSAFDFATPLPRPTVRLPSVSAAMGGPLEPETAEGRPAGPADRQQEDEALTATSQRLGRALFPATVSLLNHSCRPNCALVFEAGPVAKLVALTDVLPGQELTISYIDAERMSEQERYRRLQLHHAFSCSCGGECDLGPASQSAGGHEAMASAVPAGTTVQ